MHCSILAVLALTAGNLALSQSGESPPPAVVAVPPSEVEIDLSSFAFAPSTLALRAGVPVTLVLQNTSSGGHNFAAPEFFANAVMRSQDRAMIERGAIEVRTSSTRRITLTPRAGTYRLRCTHTLHTTFGMRGQIVVR